MTDLWGLADYSALSARLAPAAEAVVAAVAPRPGDDGVDVAARDGSAALALARAGVTTMAVDASPAMVAAGEVRCAAAGVEVGWHLGDAAALPLEDGTVDVVVSSFGVMFAPDPAAAISEIGRVLRPGGRAGLTVWSADGFMARMGAVIASFVGGPPSDPGAWTREDGIGRWCAAAGLGEVTPAAAGLPWSFADGPAMTRFLAEHSPAHVAAHAAAGARSPELARAIEELAAPGGGPVDLTAAYVLITASKGERA